MESDGIEHFVDLESDNCSSCSESDNPRDNQSERYLLLVFNQKKKVLVVTQT